MIKLKNSEVSAFGNPIISRLFEDQTRRFPPADAFLLADLTSQIQEKLKLYQKSAREVIESNGGKINGDGRVAYETLENQQKSTFELEELNNAEVEITGDRVTWKESWPNISVVEAHILRPLIRGE